MIKLVNPSQYACDDQRMSIAPTTSRGIDRDWLTKHASPRLQRFREYTPKTANHSLIHVIAMGASDHFGANRNGDSFFKTAKKLDLPEGDWKTLERADGSIVRKSDKTFGDELHKGLLETHPTFLTGHVFRDHLNDAKKDKIHGAVRASVYDDDMHRVELLMEVDHTDKVWTRDVQAVEDGKEISLSMACGRAGTLIRTTRGFISVEQVVIGDLVYTHTGKFHPVTAVSKRPADDILSISLNFWGREQLEFTSEHPFYVASYARLPEFAKGTSHAHKRNKHRTKLSSTLVWTPAAEIKAGDYLAVPIPTGPMTETLSPKMARLAGYTLGDGSFIWQEKSDRAAGIIFTQSLADIGNQDIPTLAAFTSTVSTPHNLTAKAVRLQCYGSDIAGELYVALGGRADAKRVPDALYLAHEACRMHFLTGWINSDGWQDVKGIHISTALRSRALEAQLLLATLGIPASCYRIDHNGPGTYLPGSVEYTVNIPNKYAGRFAAYGPTKVTTAFGMPKSEPTSLFIQDGYLFVKVAGVEEFPTRDWVYNMTVAGDHSYTAALCAVHNCHIPFDLCQCCGNKAVTRKQYCIHAAENLTKALKGGHVCAVANEDPNFFDISRVKRPADRIAFSLRKVAGELTDDELSNYPGLQVPLDILTAAQPAKVAQKMAILDKLSRMEKEIPAVGRSPAGLLRHARRTMEPSAEFRHLEGDRDNIPEVAQALKAAYVVLPVRQFARWICGPQGDKHAALTERALDGYFGRLMNGDALDVCASDTYASDYALRMELSMQKAAGAAGGKVTVQALQSQAAHASLAANPNAKQASAEEPGPLHQALARQYAEYVVTALSELQKSADFDLDIACAAVIPC